MTRSAPALPSLLRRAALLLALAVASVPALAAPPTDGDINRLLSASRAQSMIDTMLPQIEAMQQQQFQQVAAQRQLNAQQQEQLKRIQARTSQTPQPATATAGLSVGWRGWSGLRGTAQVRPCSLGRAIHGAHAPATGPTPPSTVSCRPWGRIPL